MYGLLMDEILDVAEIKPEFAVKANVYAGNPPDEDCTAGELLSYIFDMVPEYSSDDKQPVYFDSNRFDDYYVGTATDSRDEEAIAAFIKKFFKISEDELAELKTQIGEINMFHDYL